MSIGFLGQNPSTGVQLNDTTNDVRYVYKDEHILAGDFVQYIEGRQKVEDYGKSSLRFFCGDDNEQLKMLKTYKLNDTDTLVAISYANSVKLRVMIVRLENDQLNIIYTVDPETVSLSVTKVHEIAMLNNGDIIILHDGSRNLYATFLSYNDDMLGVKQTLKVSSTDYSATFACICDISDSYIWLMHSRTSSYYLDIAQITCVDGVWGAETVKGYTSVARASSGLSSARLGDGYCWVTCSSGGSKYYVSGYVYYFTSDSYTNVSTFSLDQSYYYNSSYTYTKLLYMDGQDKKPYIVVAYGTGATLFVKVLQLNVAKKKLVTDMGLQISGATTYNVDFDYDPDSKSIIVIYQSNASPIYASACTIVKNGNSLQAKVSSQLKLSDNSTGLTAIIPYPNHFLYMILYAAGAMNKLYYSTYIVDSETYKVTQELKRIILEQQVRYALDPPFDALALTSGFGGDDTTHFQPVKIARVHKIFNNSKFIFPTIWASIDSLHYESYEGFLLSGSSASTSMYNAVDGNRTTSWTSNSEGFSDYIMIQCPEPTKITKMRTYVTCSVPDYFSYAIIEGKKQDGEWVELSKINNAQGAVTEIPLNNTDYYLYYRLTVYRIHDTYSAVVYEWQATECEEVIE